MRVFPFTGSAGLFGLRRGNAFAAEKIPGLPGLFLPGGNGQALRRHLSVGFASPRLLAIGKDEKRPPGGLVGKNPVFGCFVFRGVGGPGGPIRCGRPGKTPIAVPVLAPLECPSCRRFLPLEIGLACGISRLLSHDPEDRKFNPGKYPGGLALPFDFLHLFYRWIRT